jgi:hypothetical protein
MDLGMRWDKVCVCLYSMCVIKGFSKCMCGWFSLWERGGGEQLALANSSLGCLPHHLTAMPSAQ